MRFLNNDSELIKNTESFKNRIRNGETIDSIAPEAYAVLERPQKEHLNKDILMSN